MANEYQLSYTGEQIDEKLSKVEPTGVTAGTYGGYASSVYSIPNITVDEYGRVISVSTSSLTDANIKNAGLMPYKSYYYLSNNQHLGANMVNTFDNDNNWHTITLSNAQRYSTSIYENGSYTSINTSGVYAVYAYIKPPYNPSSTSLSWVSIPHCVTTSYDTKYYTTTTSVHVKLPSEYAEANASLTSIRYLVLYEQAYDSVSTGM